MQSYFLAPHVYPCFTEDHVVLLDLERDKYVGVAREQVSALAGRVKGWPLVGAANPDGASDSRVPSTRAESVFSKMLATGMLTTDPDVGKEASPVTMARASEALIEPDLEWRPRVTFIDVVRFLVASAMTALALRLLPIRSVIAGVAKRKAMAGARRGPVDLLVARQATDAFIRLRPLLFAAQDACLYDSLALTRFLSYYGQFPACVIGVQTGPFGAHCWVQEGVFVFNDAPEYVRRFTPILAV
ncbi:MAG: lasso peptide biosynthesis B2 protein [Gammaproteobacteria bacterium]